MLRVLFQSIEQLLGPALSNFTFLVYWSGLILLSLALLAPFYRRWMEHVARGFGLTRHWVMTCRGCGRQTLVCGSRCGYCDADLDIPLSLKVWAKASRIPPKRKTEQIQWALNLLGGTLCLGFAWWMISSQGFPGPTSELHRLFLGFAGISFAGVRWLGGRALQLGPSSIPGRLRDGVMAMAALGFLAFSLLLAGQAQPMKETLLARFSTSDRSAKIGDQQLSLPGREIGFEYLQLDHTLLGYHSVISLAFLGQERVPLSLCPLKSPLINHLRDHPDAYARRGLTVRVRTDRLKVRPGQNYVVVQRSKQVLIKRAGIQIHNKNGT